MPRKFKISFLEILCYMFIDDRLFMNFKFDIITMIYIMGCRATRRALTL